MGKIKGFYLLLQKMAEVSPPTSTEAGTDAGLATYISLIFHKDTCNAYWFEMKSLPNSSQVIGQKVIKIILYGFSPKVLLPVQFDTAKWGSTLSLLLFLFLSWSNVVYFVNEQINFEAAEDALDSGEKI